MSKKVGIITQARMTSSRLPGKILKTIKGKTLLDYHTDRLKLTGFEVAVATTANDTDRAVADFCRARAIPCYRGDEYHVLSRYYQAAQEFSYDVIVRVTSDCPLIDPELIKRGVDAYLKKDNPQLYFSNVIDRTFARGFDFEIFSFELLENAFNHAEDDVDKEHVTPYIRKNKEGNTVFEDIKQPQNHAGLRITVDTPEDFELIKVLIEEYNAENLSYSEIERLLLEHSELRKINSHIEQKKV